MKKKQQQLQQQIISTLPSLGVGEASKFRGIGLPPSDICFYFSSKNVGAMDLKIPLYDIIAVFLS